MPAAAAQRQGDRRGDGVARLHRHRRGGESAACAEGRHGRAVRAGPGSQGLKGLARSLPAPASRTGIKTPAETPNDPLQPPTPSDRKRDAYVKGESVRVDTGGRQIITHTTQKYKTASH